MFNVKTPQILLQVGIIFFTIFIFSEQATCQSHWVQQTPQDLSSIAYGNNLFVTVGNGQIFTSDNGISWTLNKGNIPSANLVIFGNGIFIIIAGSNLFTSTDGVSWFFRSSGISNNLRSITYANGIFVAVGDSGTVISSKNGLDSIALR